MQGEGVKKHAVEVEVFLPRLNCIQSFKPDECTLLHALNIFYRNSTLNQGVVQFKFGPQVKY